MLYLMALAAVQADYGRKRASCEVRKQDYTEKINLLEADMSREWQAIESYCKKILNYSQLKGLMERLCASFTLPETSTTLSQDVNKIFGDKEVTVIFYLFHSRTGQLGLSASQKGEMRVNIEEKQGDLFDQWVAKHLKPLLVEDTRADFRFDADKIGTSRYGSVRSIMSVPLLLGKKALGLLRVDSVHEKYFTTEDVRLLSTIADLGAVAVENAQLYERVQDLAIHDSLTGLFLKRYLLERLTQEMARQMKCRKPLAFLMVDLDRFKSYNDRYGHPAGDIVLKAVGRIIRELFAGPSCFVCRYGGEEFAVVVPDCPKEKAMSLAEDLRRRIEQEVLLLRRNVTHVTVSVGVAVFPDDAQLKEELVGKADYAMYKAKQQGRNRVCGC